MGDEADALRAPAMLLLGAAIMLELALFLHWRVPAFSNDDVSVFGSAGAPGRLAAASAAVGGSRDVWSAVPLAGVLLALLGLAGIAVAVGVIGRRPEATAAAPVLGIAGVAAATYCVVRLAHGRFTVTRTSRFADVSALLVDHGPGVVLALCAAVMLALGAVALAMRARQDG